MDRSGSRPGPNSEQIRKIGPEWAREMRQNIGNPCQMADNKGLWLAHMWKAMAGNGEPCLAMPGHAWPWTAMPSCTRSCHTRPWPAMSCMAMMPGHAWRLPGQRCLDMRPAIAGMDGHGAFGAPPRGRRFAPPPWVLLSNSVRIS